MVFISWIKVLLDTFIGRIFNCCISVLYNRLVDKSYKIEHFSVLGKIFIDNLYGWQNKGGTQYNEKNFKYCFINSKHNYFCVSFAL